MDMDDYEIGAPDIIDWLGQLGDGAQVSVADLAAFFVEYAEKRMTPRDRAADMNRKMRIERLAAKFDAAHIEDAIDEMVRDAHMDMAAGVYQHGTASAIEWLLDGGATFPELEKLLPEADREPTPEEALRELHALLYPPQDPERQWEVDTIEHVAEVVERAMAVLDKAPAPVPSEAPTPQEPEPEQQWDIDRMSSDDRDLYVNIAGTGSVVVKRTADGVSVDIYPFDIVDGPVASAWAANADLLSDE